MGSKRLDSLGDLARHRCQLSLKCRRCGHHRDLQPGTLHNLGVPYNRPMEAVAAKLKCGRCGGKAIDWFARPPGM